MKIEKLFNSVIPVLCGVFLTLIIIFTFSQVVVRNFFDATIVWSDELSQFCMMWMVLIGSIYLSKYNLHINTGLKIHQKLNKRFIALIDSIIALAAVGSAGVVAYQSALFAFSGYKAISLPWLSMVYVYIAMPLFMLAMCYYYSKNFFGNLVKVFKRD
jgi:TRAP-type C4-dicarboxylate transport system permease small subunit